MAYQINWEEKGIFVAFSGKLETSEISDCDESFFSDSRFGSCKYFIYDFSKADLSGLTLEQTHELGGDDLTRSTLNPSIRGALVYGDDYAKFLCKQYVYYCEKLMTNWHVNYFDNVEAAISWVRHHS